MSEDDLVVIPLPTNKGTITHAVARLVSESDRPFAEAIAAVPDTDFAPPRRIALSRYSSPSCGPAFRHIGRICTSMKG